MRNYPDFRKMLAGLLLTAVLGLTACGQKAEIPVEDFMKEESIRLTMRMKDLAASPAYLEAMSLSTELDTAAQQIASQDYSTPTGIYTLKITDENVLALLGHTDRKLAEPVMTELHRRMNAASYGNLLNATNGSGAVTIAATTLFACQQSWQMPGNWKEDTLVILQYPGQYSSMVSFMETGDGVIGSYATFVKNGNTDMIEELKMFLSLESGDIAELP